MSYEIIRNARVEIDTARFDQSGDLAVLIDGRFQHVFGRDSTLGQKAAAMDFESLEEYLNGGSYFFVEGSLVDFVPSDYTGHIHTDEAIEGLASILGYQRSSARRPAHGVINRRFGAGSSGIFLGGPVDRFELDIEDFDAFENTLYCRWSPFSQNVTTALLAERLICRNGMIGTAEAVRYETPLINGLEENLRVAVAHLRPAISDTLARRFRQMSETRASVEEVMRANAELRARQGRLDEVSDAQAAEHLRRLREHLDPRVHLEAIYPRAALDDKVAKVLASHVTQYDLFNILTEASTHVVGEAGANEASIQRLANRLVFDEVRGRAVNPTLPQSQESDPRRAFFGKV